jgi:hypothetical protein
MPCSSEISSLYESTLGPDKQTKPTSAKSGVVGSLSSLSRHPCSLAASKLPGRVRAEAHPTPSSQLYDALPQQV